LKVGNF